MQSPNPSDLLKVKPVCQLTIAYAQQSKIDLAKQTLSECMTLADKANDPQGRVEANVANTSVHFASNDLGAAEDSLQYLLSTNPEIAENHLELAMALVGKDLEKGLAMFNQGIKLIHDKKDLNAEAAAFDRMASALGSIGLSQHKKQQLDYLKSAEGLYQQVKNLGAEGGVNLELGTYYANNSDNKSAVSYFEVAGSLAQQAQNSGLAARAAWMSGTHIPLQVITLIPAHFIEMRLPRFISSGTRRLRGGI